MKKLFPILIALSTLLYSCASQPRFAYAGPKNPRGDQDLVETYDYFNKTYFKDLLPKNVILVFKPEPEMKGYIAYTIEPFSPGVLHIRFNEKFKSDTKITHLFLLHEMCHVKTWPQIGYPFDGHTTVWRQCMLDLERQHASWPFLIDHLDEGEDTK